jgi:ketosteroid isomerase-like protein
MRFVKIFLLGIVFFSLQALGQTGQEKEVADAVEKLRKAMVDPDKAMLESLVSDKLSYGHSSGALDDKAIFLDKFLSGKSDFVELQFDKQTISISGKAAVVRHVLNATTNDGGKPGEVHINVLLVWQKVKGKWVLLARQAVKMPA